MKVKEGESVVIVVGLGGWGPETYGGRVPTYLWRDRIKVNVVL